MKCFLLLSLLVFTCSGCAFIGGGSIGDVVYTSPLRNDKMLKSDFTFRQSTPYKQFQYSDIVSEWGTPSKIAEDGNNKSVTFETGLRWKGVVLILVSPLRLPLAVPVGRKTVTFHFKNDSLINWQIHDDHYCVSYSSFGLIPFDPEGRSLGFNSETSCEWHKDMTPYDGNMECDLLFYDKCYPRH